jgi:hypothetical protein
MAKNCDFGNVGLSMLRDPIIIGICYDATRHKLLQVNTVSEGKWQWTEKNENISSTNQPVGQIGWIGYGSIVRDGQ